MCYKSDAPKNRSDTRHCGRTPGREDIETRIQIRKMTQADFPAVAALEREIFSDPWTEQGFSDALQTEVNLFFVAACRRKENGERHSGFPDSSDHIAPVKNEKAERNDAGDREVSVAGYGILYMAGDEGEIVRVAVAEEARRQGIGDRLLVELLAAAGQQGVRRIFLEVRESNGSAIRLYKKLGFVPCGTRRDFYRHPAEDALCMVRESDTRNDLCYYNGE